MGQMGLLTLKRRSEKLFRGLENSPVGILCTIALLAFGLRFAVVVSLGPGHYIHGDTVKYVENARAILDTGMPTLNRAPIGFSYILMPLLALGTSLRNIGYFIEPTMGMFDCILAYVLCCSFGSRLAGLLAAFICAIHPALINGSSQILTEDWAIFCILLSLALVRVDKKLYILTGGLLMGFACTIRSPNLSMFLGISAWWIFLDGRAGLRKAAFYWLGAAIPMLVVSVHLSLASNHLAFLTLQQDETNWLKPVLGGYQLITSDETLDRKGYLHFAATHPVQFAQERVLSFLTFVSPWPLDEERTLKRKLILLVSDGSILLVALASAVVLLRRGSHYEWFLLLWLPLCLCAFYTLLFSIPRYRLPAIPLLIVFSCLVLVKNSSARDKKVDEDLPTIDTPLAK